MAQPTASDLQNIDVLTDNVFKEDDSTVAQGISQNLNSIIATGTSLAGSALGLAYNIYNLVKDRSSELQDSKNRRYRLGIVLPSERRERLIVGSSYLADLKSKAMSDDIIKHYEQGGYDSRYGYWDFKTKKLVPRKPPTDAGWPGTKDELADYKYINQTLLYKRAYKNSKTLDTIIDFLSPKMPTYYSESNILMLLRKGILPVGWSVTFATLQSDKFATAVRYWQGIFARKQNLFRINRINEVNQSIRRAEIETKQLKEKKKLENNLQAIESNITAISL